MAWVEQKMSGFGCTMKILSVPVTSSLTLEAGTSGGGEDALTILPPSVAMFDQLLDWLSRQTPPDPAGFSTTMIGIGATALCLRWGTYLAVLFDEHKHVDPRVESSGISMISDPEMKRINLEFSANLARLIHMLHKDERGCYRLLHLAHDRLAMPRLRHKPCAEFLDALRALTSPGFWKSAGPDLRARMERIRPTVAQHPYRVLANTIVLSAYRNGPVENLHSGRSSAICALNHRRATDRQTHEVMRFTSERLGAVLSKFRPWEQSADFVVSWPENLAGIYISPFYSSSTWSLTESCSRIDLESPSDPRPAGC
jgi:hypothetical protein